MTETSLKNIDFSYIRYANCWEDANVLIKGLSPQSGSKILSIGSAGDNSFSLLTTNPEKIVALDISPSQIFLIELKKMAIKHLSYANTLAFLGFTPSENRMELFQELFPYLSHNARTYWKTNSLQLQEGIIHQGKFEKYFKIFSKRILPLIHRKKIINGLMVAKSAEKQLEFYRNNWNTFRWRVLFSLFFSRAVMGKYGRDKKFFKEVNEPVAKSIFNRVERHLQSENVFNNEFLNYILHSNFDLYLPHYLLPENFEVIKKNIDALEITQASFGSYLSKNSNFTHFNLSDIFEYLSDVDFKRTIKIIEECTNSGTKFVYWNLLVPRRLSEVKAERFIYHQQLSAKLAEIDKGFFYGPVIIDERK